MSGFPAPSFLTYDHSGSNRKEKKRRNLRAVLADTFILGKEHVRLCELETSRGTRGMSMPVVVFPSSRSVRFGTNFQDGANGYLWWLRATKLVVSAAEHGRTGVCHCFKNPLGKSSSDPGVRSYCHAWCYWSQLLKLFIHHLFYRIIISHIGPWLSHRHPSFLHVSRCCFLTLDSPPCLLVTSSPFSLHIA